MKFGRIVLHGKYPSIDGVGLIDNMTFYIQDGGHDVLISAGCPLTLRERVTSLAGCMHYSS